MPPTIGWTPGETGSATHTPATDPTSPYVNTDTPGLDPTRGFALRYNPTQLNNVYSTPWSILPDVFRGINTAGAGYQSLRDIGGDPLTLYNLMAGHNQDLYSAGPGGYTNWLANLYKTLGTKGGGTFDASELLRYLFNPVGGEPGTPEGEGTQSALYNILTTGDAGTQMDTILRMARDASNVGMNPLAARGYQAALIRAGDKATNMQMNTTGANNGPNNAPMYQVLRQLAPGLVPG